jgi:hypothetical protein
MIFSLPPLLPVCQSAWLIHALGKLGQNDADDDFVYVGNVGLMELDALKKRTGGWVASERIERGCCLIILTLNCIVTISHIRRHLQGSSAAV